MSRDANQAKAPQSAKFVNAMREVFQELKVERVREGEIALGDDDTAIYATCFVIDKKNERRANKR